MLKEVQNSPVVAKLNEALLSNREDLFLALLQNESLDIFNKYVDRDRNIKLSLPDIKNDLVGLLLDSIGEDHD